MTSLSGWNEEEGSPALGRRTAFHGARALSRARRGDKVKSMNDEERAALITAIDLATKYIGNAMSQSGMPSLEQGGLDQLNRMSALREKLVAGEFAPLEPFARTAPEPLVSAPEAPAQRARKVRNV